ncbi:hypothetical protein SS1G_13118 [Sclerotinia sclerotiorum 1980 UF-70]|uniref:non-specific serine/threonine protein kinase n=1 Tax=Sclerotinia sclerotiorum (strain ATCC 18683 / 1980 / Ss-1) TaxID=665079 RepID=A7F689_SCLS1|nr:hypothetical protein SS1G_13118 [Sclerotinia sclerotiorum 1980 UF-70]EDN98260.1 hypothetical protein SS1G_13118 [Sclerotinia sclerotiorum 1980 UF-70]
MKAENYPPGRLMISQSMNTADASKGHGSGTTGLKRLISQIDAPLPPSKRPCLISLTKADTNVLQNRVHRRVILRDYGKPIYMASSPAALLNALKDCIEGYESLHKAGFLHRDISINNLMINEDKENPSWPSFLIDLDLAIKETRGGGLLAPEEGLDQTDEPKRMIGAWTWYSSSDIVELSFQVSEGCDKVLLLLLAAAASHSVNPRACDINWVTS